MTTDTPLDLSRFVNRDALLRECAALRTQLAERDAEARDYAAARQNADEWREQCLALREALTELVAANDWSINCAGVGDDNLSGVASRTRLRDAIQAARAALKVTP